VEAVADYAGVMAAGGPDRRAMPRVAESAKTSATHGPSLVCLDDVGLDAPGAIDRRGTAPLDAIETMRSQDVLVLRDVWDHVADLDQLRDLANGLVGRNLHLRAEAQRIDTRTDRGRVALDGFRTLATPPTRPAGRRPKLHAAAIERARALIADGMSVTDVAAELGVHRATLHRHL
jgi:DNA invertase Pin-like site-specific DNA recombinase